MVVGSVALIAGSETVVHPIFHRNMDIDDATQARALDDVQQPWSDGRGRTCPTREHFSSVETGDLAMGKVTMRMITAKPGPFRIGSIKNTNGYCLSPSTMRSTA